MRAMMLNAPVPLPPEKVYDGPDRREQTATANKIFNLLYREEMTDSLIKISSRTPHDSIDMLVWYWAGEHLWTTHRTIPGDCDMLRRLCH